mgnify:FL=1
MKNKSMSQMNKERKSPQWKLVTFHEDGKQFTTWHHEKPDFKLMYKKIGTDMIELQTAYIPELSNRKDGYVDIWFDEEGKLKGMPIVNIKITEAWTKWLSNTGRQALEGDCIVGKVCVYQKVSEEAA